MVEDKSRPKWIGDSKKPEDAKNHEFGKWCYNANQHCDEAIILYDCDCDWYKEHTKQMSNI